MYHMSWKILINLAIRMRLRLLVNRIIVPWRCFIWRPDAFYHLIWNNKFFEIFSRQYCKHPSKHTPIKNEMPKTGSEKEIFHVMVGHQMLQYRFTWFFGHFIFPGSENRLPCSIFCSFDFVISNKVITAAAKIITKQKPMQIGIKWNFAFRRLRFPSETVAFRFSALSLVIRCSLKSLMRCLVKLRHAEWSWQATLRHEVHWSPVQPNDLAVKCYLPRSGRRNEV